MNVVSLCEYRQKLKMLDDVFIIYTANKGTNLEKGWRKAYNRFLKKVKK
jgi:hypothetical protein